MTAYDIFKKYPTLKDFEKDYMVGQKSLYKIARNYFSFLQDLIKEKEGHGRIEKEDLKKEIEKLEKKIKNLNIEVGFVEDRLKYEVFNYPNSSAINTLAREFYEKKSKKEFLETSRASLEIAFNKVISFERKEYEFETMFDLLVKNSKERVG